MFVRGDAESKCASVLSFSHLITMRALLCSRHPAAHVSEPLLAATRTARLATTATSSSPGQDHRAAQRASG